MMKEVIRAMETGMLAEIGLLAFFVAFVLIVVRAFLMPKSDREDAKQMPLDDREEERPFLMQPHQRA